MKQVTHHYVHWSLINSCLKHEVLTPGRWLVNQCNITVKWDMWTEESFYVMAIYQYPWEMKNYFLSGMFMIISTKYLVKLSPRKSLFWMSQQQKCRCTFFHVFFFLFNTRFRTSDKYNLLANKDWISITCIQRLYAWRVYTV